MLLIAHNAFNYSHLFQLNLIELNEGMDSKEKGMMKKLDL
jgi:hypothetical protein